MVKCSDCDTNDFSPPAHSPQSDAADTHEETSIVSLLQILLFFAGDVFWYHKAENYRHSVKNSVDVFGKMGMLGVWQSSCSALPAERGQGQFGWIGIQEEWFHQDIRSF